jgi:hypothetical protein
MRRHSIPQDNWPEHLARALRAAEDGDVILLPDVESYSVGQQIAAESYPEKNLRLCVPSMTAGLDPSSGISVEQYMQLRTLEGNPPGPGEVQQWLNHERRRMQRETILKEWFTRMLDEFLDPAMEFGGLELVETSEALIEQMAYHIGVCIHSTAEALTPEGRDLFLGKAEQAIQDQMELGMAHDED